jgi:hypothetical protein
MDQGTLIGIKGAMASRRNDCTVGPRLSHSGSTVPTMLNSPKVFGVVWGG